MLEAKGEIPRYGCTDSVRGCVMRAAAGVGGRSGARTLNVLSSDVTDDVSQESSGWLKRAALCHK